MLRCMMWAIAAAIRPKVLLVADNLCLRPMRNLAGLQFCALQGFQALEGLPGMQNRPGNGLTVGRVISVNAVFGHTGSSGSTGIAARDQPVRPTLLALQVRLLK